MNQMKPHEQVSGYFWRREKAVIRITGRRDRFRKNQSGVTRRDAHVSACDWVLSAGYWVLSTTAQTKARVWGWAPRPGPAVPCGGVRRGDSGYPTGGQSMPVSGSTTLASMPSYSSE